LDYYREEVVWAYLLELDGESLQFDDSSEELVGGVITDLRLKADDSDFGWNLVLSIADIHTDAWSFQNA
jgi:hypothetical protein